MTHRIARLCWLLVLFAGAALAAAEGRQVAITIDDLPRGGDRGPGDLSGIRAMTQGLLRPFREQHIPVIGFVNAGRSQLDSKGMQEILNLWIDAGAELGNHSYSHPSPSCNLACGASTCITWNRSSNFSSDGRWRCSGARSRRSC